MNHLSRWWRWPVKGVIFAAGVALVAFPYVWLIPTWLVRLGDLNAVLDPAHPRVVALAREIDATLPDGATDQQRLAAVESAVERRIPYAWDWDVWGVADYVPTIDEVFEKGREDCDGRAVLAASVLRQMGGEAWLVNDLLHVWVETPQGETMSPGRGAKTIVGPKRGEVGSRMELSPALLGNLARSLSFGIAVFPLAREAILVVLFVALCLRPGTPAWRGWLGCVLSCGALATWRGFGESYARGQSDLAGWGVLLGVGMLLGGWGVLMVRAKPTTAGRPRGCAAARPGSRAADDASPG